jgi:hypothetical protein
VLEAGLRSAPRPGLFPTGKSPGIHCTGGRVSLRASLDGGEKCRPHQDSIPDSPARGKVVGRKTNHSHPNRAEVKNIWSHTSTPPTCIHGVNRNDFSFFTTFVMICLMTLLQPLRMRNIEWYGHLFSSNIKGVVWRAYISSLRILRQHCVV